MPAQLTLQKYDSDGDAAWNKDSAQKGKSEGKGKGKDKGRRGKGPPAEEFGKGWRGRELWDDADWALEYYDDDWRPEDDWPEGGYLADAEQPASSGDSWRQPLAGQDDY